MAGGQGSGGNPAQGGVNPGFPANTQVLVFDGYKGLNTRPARPAIDNDECYQLENFMPIGKENLRTTYGSGTALYTAGQTIVFFGFANIATVTYCIVFLTDGSVVAVNSATGATTTVAAAGTIQNPSRLTLGLTQWGNQYVLISSNQTGGYFIWDGTLLYKATTIGPDVVINYAGTDYTSQPTMVAITGSGSHSGSFSAVLQNGTITSISPLSAGSGYSYTDAGYILFSGGGCSGTTAQIAATITGGSISTLSIVSGGSGYATASTVVAVLGGGGGGASVTAQSNAGGTITGTSIVNHGQGYVSAPAIYATDVNNPVAQARVEIMPFGIQGSAIETFQGHVWVANGTRVQFTAPNTAADFGSPDGGGAFKSTDSFLRNAFTGLRQANGFLYMFADSSVNVISNVNTSAGTSTSSPTTTFSNNNVDPQIGSAWPQTIQVFSRNIVFANISGVYVSYGGAVAKVSGPLDGVFSSFPAFGGFTPSSALANVFGVNIYMILLPTVNSAGATVNKLFCWDGQHWFSSTQGITLTQVAYQEINSVLSAWGTDGTSIYPLFNQPSTSLGKTVQSKLWADPGYFISKVARRLYGVLYYYSILSSAVTITLDNGSSSTQVLPISPLGTSQWTGAGGVAATWTGLGGVAATWTAVATAVFGPIGVSQPGPLIGLTLTTNAADMALLSLTVIEQTYSANV